jgi:hypothetical protein
MSVSAGAGNAVDEFEALRLEAGEFGLDVVRTVGDVMQAGPTTFDEPTDRRFRAQRLEKFHSADEGDAHSLSLEHFRGGTGFPKQGFVEATRLFERGNGDAHVVEWAAYIDCLNH